MIDQRDIPFGINVVLRMIKEHKYNEAQKQIEIEIERLLQTEVNERRKKVDEINKSIFLLDMTIKKITIQYQYIKRSCPDTLLSSVDNYIKQLKEEKSRLEVKKRYTARN